MGIAVPRVSVSGLAETASRSSRSRSHALRDDAGLKNLTWRRAQPHELRSNQRGRKIAHRARVRFALLLVLVAACRPAGVQQVGADWSVEPRELHFGSSTQQTLTVSNRSRASIPLQISVDAPFEAASSITLEGGATYDLPVLFHPAAPGPAAGILTIGDIAIP